MQSDAKPHVSRLGEGAEDREVFERSPEIGVPVWVARAAEKFDRVHRHQLGRMPQVAQVDQRRWNLQWEPFDKVLVENTRNGGTVLGRGGVGRHG